ncbi:hypothetical protein PO909_020020 [Leuciscus waleckii]
MSLRGRAEVSAAPPPETTGGRCGNEKLAGSVPSSFSLPPSRPRSRRHSPAPPPLQGMRQRSWTRTPPLKAPLCSSRANGAAHKGYVRKQAATG